jgi:hypothetical protein
MSCSRIILASSTKGIAVPDPTLSKLRRAGLGLAAGLLTAAPALAQVGSAVPLERQVDDAFRAMFQNPGDAGSMGRYAELLLQAGNYEGAIATLERLLVDPAAPPSVRIDIAVLYARLKSYTMAESMLREALKDPRLSPADRERAERLLGDVAARNRPSQLSGSIALGLRYNSNATFRTDAQQVYANGTLVAVPPQFRPDSDVDATVALRLGHQYDLELDRFAVVSSTLGAYLTNQKSSSGSELRAGFSDPYDLGVLEFTSGLLFSPVRGQDALTVRPHLILGQVWAQQHRFLASAGLGLDLNYRIGPRTLFDATADWQRRDYADRVDVPNAAQLDAHAVGLRGRLTHDLGAGQVVSAELALRRNRAGQASSDFDAVDGRIAYTLSYAAPMASAAGNWSTTAWLGTTRRHYGGADRSVLAGVSRRDNEWRLGLSQAVPLAPLWTGVLSLEHARNNANLPNYEFRNTSLSASVVRSF